MQLLLDGNPFFPGTVTIRESVFEYGTVLSFTSNMPLIFEEIALQITENIPYVPVVIEQLDVASFQYVCYPKGYVDFLQNVSRCVSVNTDLPGLLDTLSVCDYICYHKTQSTHWILPSLRGKNLLDELTNRVTSVNGGCPTFHFGVSGKLIFSDLLVECGSDYAGAFFGTLSKSRSSTASMNTTPGKVNFVFYDEDTFTDESATFQEGTGVSNVFRYVVNKDTENQVISEMQSRYWRKFVANSLRSYDNVQSPSISPGVKVRNLYSEEEFICVSSIATMSAENTELSVQLFPVIKPEQML